MSVRGRGIVFYVAIAAALAVAGTTWAALPAPGAKPAAATGKSKAGKQRLRRAVPTATVSLRRAVPTSTPRP